MIKDAIPKPQVAQWSSRRKIRRRRGGCSERASAVRRFSKSCREGTRSNAVRRSDTGRSICGPLAGAPGLDPSQARDSHLTGQNVRRVARIPTIQDVRRRDPALSRLPGSSSAPRVIESGRRSVVRRTRPERGRWHSRIPPETKGGLTEQLICRRDWDRPPGAPGRSSPDGTPANAERRPCNRRSRRNTAFPGTRPSTSTGPGRPAFHIRHPIPRPFPTSIQERTELAASTHRCLLAAVFRLSFPSSDGLLIAAAHSRRRRRNRRELATTLTELRAIASAARIGCSCRSIDGGITCAGADGANPSDRLPFVTGR